MCTNLAGMRSHVENWYKNDKLHHKAKYRRHIGRMDNVACVLTWVLWTYAPRGEHVPYKHSPCLRHCLSELLQALEVRREQPASVIGPS